MGVDVRRSIDILIIINVFHRIDAAPSLVADLE